MKAARFYGIQDVRVDEVEIPKAEEDQVLVRVKWCGICGSDLKNFTSGELSRALVQANVAIGITVLGPIGTPTNEHADPYTGKLLPVTLGHEFCGVVEEAPEGCSLAVGQAVVVDPRLYCTTCDMCANGDTNLCNKASFIGLSGSHGGFSGLVPVRWKQCHAIPHSLLDFAALIEPLAVARRALRITGMQDLSGKTALVLGGGPIGQAVIFNLRAMGAKRIFVSEVMASRRKQLEAIAGLDILDPVACDVPAEIRSRMNSDGVHLAIDCAGAAPALAAGLNSLRQKGIFIMVAGSLGSSAIPIPLWMGKELTLLSSRAYTETEFKDVVDDFVQGKFEGVESMVTGRIKLESFVSDGLKRLQQDTGGGAVKILVEPV